MMRGTRKIGHRGLALGTMLLLVTPLQAEWKLPDSFQVHGFASQAFILTTDNNFFGNSKDNGTFDFRELGINASWRILPRLQFAAQGVARWAGENDEGDPRLDYGLVDYTVFSDPKNTWGIRLGRVINPIGFYNDTRDVAFTRPSIFLPQSIYFDRTRDLALSADGGQIYGERRTDIGDFFLQFNIAKPRLGSREELALLGHDFLGGFEGDTSVFGRLFYEKDGGSIRLGFSSLWADFDFDSGLPPNKLSSGSIEFSPLIFSGQYNGEKLSLTSEVALRRFDYAGFGPNLPDKDFTGLSWYVQAAYRFLPKWEAVVRFDSLCVELGDCDGEEYAAQSGRSGHQRFAHRRFADDWMVGLRWDVTPSVMLRAEFHHIKGTAWITLEDNPDINALEEEWNMFSVLVSFRF
ncbi:TonB-dependent receptor [Nitrosococcus wardiae]|uniref:TonB-dependent receptor n=1 Tax=Nitrosococcus wardiae TaxID=1814290 RepID=A0A4P7C3Z8_9GAMM|nr:TonB-dependent receptor [Nitrosococcus wardiae]QBQ55542.1 TonB-dependent receptor [Nitrosococcus wardiae]